MLKTIANITDGLAHGQVGTWVVSRNQSLDLAHMPDPIPIPRQPEAALSCLDLCCLKRHRSE